MGTNARLIFNPVAGRIVPVAGRSPTRELLNRAVERLESAGWQVQVLETTGAEHTTRLARQAAADGIDALFVAGGDGTVGQAIAGLLGSETALGVLPAGTANVWAQELGLHGLTWTRLLALEESAESLANAPIQRMDVGICNGRPFMLWAGIGLDAKVVHEIEKQRTGPRQFPEMQYGASMLKTAYEWKGMHLEVAADGEQVSGEYLLAVISNIQSYAGGLAKISPHACLDDSEMDLWLFDNGDIGQAMVYVWDLLTGHHSESQQVHRVPFRNLRIRSDHQLFLQMDGEPIDPTDEVEIRILPKVLRVLVTPQASENLFQEPPETPDNALK
jgi:YegS/Rv2252/BmrU family lipid kinase